MINLFINLWTACGSKFIYLIVIPLSKPLEQFHFVQVILIAKARVGVYWVRETCFFLIFFLFDFLFKLADINLLILMQHNPLLIGISRRELNVRPAAFFFIKCSLESKEIQKLYLSAQDGYESTQLYAVSVVSLNFIFLRWNLWFIFVKDERINNHSDRSMAFRTTPNLPFCNESLQLPTLSRYIIKLLKSYNGHQLWLNYQDCIMSPIFCLF